MVLDSEKGRKQTRPAISSYHATYVNADTAYNWNHLYTQLVASSDGGIKINDALVN